MKIGPDGTGVPMLPQSPFIANISIAVLEYPRAWEHGWDVGSVGRDREWFVAARQNRISYEYIVEQDGYLKWNIRKVCRYRYSTIILPIPARILRSLEQPDLKAMLD